MLDKEACLSSRPLTIQGNETVKQIFVNNETERTNVLALLNRHAQSKRGEEMEGRISRRGEFIPTRRQLQTRIDHICKNKKSKKSKEKYKKKDKLYTHKQALFKINNSQPIR